MNIPDSIQVNVLASIFSNSTARNRNAKILCITLHENDYEDVDYDTTIIFNTRIKLDKEHTYINNEALTEYLTEENVTTWGLIAFNEMTNTWYFTSRPTSLPTAFLNFVMNIIAYGERYQCTITANLIESLVASLAIGNKALLTFTKVT